MKSVLIFNIGQLISVKGASKKPKIKGQMNELGIIDDGAVFMKDGIIAAVGKTKDVMKKVRCCGVSFMLDAYQSVVMPGFVDCHTHAVFGGTRVHEYEAKIKGEVYEGQHGQGRGILYTVGKTREAPETFLFLKGLSVLEKALEYGTTTMEIKSGYGLDFENEIKILMAINNLRALAECRVTVVPTFLGAHTVPSEYEGSRQEYVNLMIKILPKIKEKGLAEFIDVFCDRIGFTAYESIEILSEAHKLGFKIKAHVDQTGNAAAYQLLNKFPFVSVDHMDYTSLHRLSRKGFISVLLPGVTYHLMEINKKTFWEKRAQEIIDAGFPVALATDYNPGSCPCFSMQTIMELAARLYRMTPAQIINAVTINAAHAIGRADKIGSIEVGKRADILVCDASDYREMINNFGTNKIRTVIKNGEIVK
jgi:imidazolonepropionase